MKTTPAIYIVSGGTGASGSMLVETALAQFPKANTALVKHTHIRRVGQLEAVAAEAGSTGGLIVHTLVDSDLRRELLRICEEQRVPSIDLIGELMERLALFIGREPEEKPGLYRKLRQNYFDRIAAIEFAIAHDDGQLAENAAESDIVILGVSRCGKTPLCMYLAVRGWKASNIPIIPGVSLPASLKNVDPRRVFGMVMEAESLAGHRKKRVLRMGGASLEPYAETSTVMKELDEARTIYKRGRYSVLDVTDKPIESTAEEIVELMVRHFGS